MEGGGQSVRVPGVDGGARSADRGGVRPQVGVDDGVSGGVYACDGGRG